MDSEEEFKRLRLDNDDESSASTLFLPPQYQSQPERHWKHARHIYIGLFAMAVLAWTSGLVWFWHYKEKSPYALTLRGHCGYSVAEAKANDCIYDIMLSSWVSKPCYNKELSDKYLAANNFTYYEHSNALVEIPEEEVRKGEFTRIFTHFNYHTQHCIYLWNLQILAAKMRRPILDSISRNQRHIEHCFHLITAVTGPNYTTWNQPITGTPIHVRPIDLKCWEG